MNTLYEILEVSENASKEVIEKAYKVLAKKYHPDLQLLENKKIAEIKMKQINEAYEVLSDDIKRKEYNETLAKQREQEKQNSYNASMQYRDERSFVNQKNEVVQQETYNKTEDMQKRRYEEDLKRQQEKMRKQMEENIQQEYENAYYQYLRSLGFRIKERWTWEKTKKLLLALFIMGIIITILWLLPPTHDMMIDFYESNPLVKIMVDIIGGIIIAIFKTIGSMVSSILGAK